MQIIVSNTMEVGIQLVEDDIRQSPPVSFPGKLLAFLYRRYTAFNGSPDSGMIIIPTELIVDNGKKLAGIVGQLARKAGLEDVVHHLDGGNHTGRFCSSLVDRIVPGKPDGAALQQLTHGLGYTDDLLAIAEVYRLWAIEGDEKVRSVLSFAAADPGVVIEPDIEVHRELKLRLLNGTHTLSCGLAFLSGFATVKNAMDDAAFSAYITDLDAEGDCAVNPLRSVPAGGGARFWIGKVLDRFRNPHLQHQWLSITMQYTSKMKMRVMPVLLRHYQRHTTPPVHIALGFAAYLLFMRGVKKVQDVWHGEFRRPSRQR